MVKYSPKENTYKEMYLINKFEKDIMENSLQNLKDDKRKTTEKGTMVNNIPLETQKEALENSNKKTMQPVQASQNQVFNENSILDISGDKNTTTEKELPLNIDLSDNGNTLENTNNTTLSGNNAVLSPSNLKRILATEKRAVKKIKKIRQEEKKKLKNKDSKSPERRTTRKIARDLNKKRITVKNVSKPLSTITSKTDKKLKSGNANETIDEIFQNWNV